MKIEKYSFKQTETHPEEVSITLTELQKEFEGTLTKSTVKEWVLSGATIKGSKIKLFKKNANTKN